jgi:hypothetical protein
MKVEAKLAKNVKQLHTLTFVNNETMKKKIFKKKIIQKIPLNKKDKTHAI